MNALPREGTIILGFGSEKGRRKPVYCYQYSRGVLLTRVRFTVMEAEVQKFAPNVHLWSGHSQVLLTGVSRNIWMHENCRPGERPPGLSTASQPPL